MDLRRQVFVERKLQLRFARFILTLSAGGALVTGLAVFYATYFILGEKLANVYPQRELVAVFRNVHLALLASLAAVAPFIFYASLVFSHRVAGPLPKIYRALDAIGEGKFDVKLQLREKDELRELADAINRMASKLQARQPK